MKSVRGYLEAISIIVLLVLALCIGAPLGVFELVRMLQPGDRFEQVQRANDILFPSIPAKVDPRKDPRLAWDYDLCLNYYERMSSITEEVKETKARWEQDRPNMDVKKLPGNESSYRLTLHFRERELEDTRALCRQFWHSSFAKSETLPENTTTVIPGCFPP